MFPCTSLAQDTARTPNYHAVLSAGEAPRGQQGFAQMVSRSALLLPRDNGMISKPRPRAERMQAEAARVRAALLAKVGGGATEPKDAWHRLEAALPAFRSCLKIAEACDLLASLASQPTVVSVA